MNGKGIEQQVDAILSQGKSRKRPINLEPTESSGRQVRQRTNRFPPTPPSCRVDSKSKRPIAIDAITPVRLFKKPANRNRPGDSGSGSPTLFGHSLSSRNISCEANTTPPPLEEAFKDLMPAPADPSTPMPCFPVANDLIDLEDGGNGGVNFDEIPSSAHGLWFVHHPIQFRLAKRIGYLTDVLLLEAPLQLKEEGLALLIPSHLDLTMACSGASTKALFSIYVTICHHALEFLRLVKCPNVGTMLDKWLSTILFLAAWSANCITIHGDSTEWTWFKLLIQYWKPLKKANLNSCRML
jgi:hypothetical protein